jgi:dipeptidyl aminopeptidase
MAKDAEESHPLTAEYNNVGSARSSLDTDSVTSIVLENLNGRKSKYKQSKPIYTDKSTEDLPEPDSFDVEDTTYARPRPADRKARRIFWIIAILCAIGWGAAATQFIWAGGYKHSSATPHNPAATSTKGSGKKVTLGQVLDGEWRAYRHAIGWIRGPKGEDGLIMEKGGSGPGYLTVEDVTSTDGSKSKVLMHDPLINVRGRSVFPQELWPSPDQNWVLAVSDRQSNWRHSFTGLYWILNVKTQQAEPLDPNNPNARVQLATWSPQSNAIAFTRDNNMYLRKLDAKGTIVKITNDGSADLFYGIPDWVYEEEVFSGNSATWWSEDGGYLAYLRTNESQVPTYPIQYFLSRPSRKKPKPGEENYPDIVDIKYPKAGAPNPTVDIQFYDVEKNTFFSVKIEDDFPDNDRIINEVVWAGKEGKALVKETNRVSDHMKLILVDAKARTGHTVRDEDVKALDGGWFEVSEDTTYIPADPANGRPDSGYVDTVIHEGYDHLGYFTPLDNPKPIMLTSGKYEVVKAPSAIDLKNNFVYFKATKESPIQRHAYRVKLDGSGMTNITDISQEGFYDVSFSSSGGYALLTYEGPNVPWQKLISTPGASPTVDRMVEENEELKGLAAEHELPIKIYQTVTIDNFELNLVERRPPHFDPKKKYPVLFWMYQGPGSQYVTKEWNVDFQSYIAATLGYVVVTLDGRGTGNMGRATRCIIRGNIGHYEARDQIEAAKMWAAKDYVDSNRMAIWGWSYGGFMALKVLEEDAGRTFKYGMAVAPVTDWRYYGKLFSTKLTFSVTNIKIDSIYTERYMFTPQTNPGGYFNTSIHDMAALAKNVRFLVMHGVADDNVHTQSTYTLLDKLDLAGVTNYDVHVFPDSDHSIYFHNANQIVYSSKYGSSEPPQKIRD